MGERQDALNAAIAEIFERNRPIVAERLGCIRDAARAIADADDGAPDETVMNAGRSAAHKLAGSLGSFGYARGSELAREAELMLTAPDPDGARIAEIADEIERVIS